MQPIHLNKDTPPQLAPSGPSLNTIMSPPSPPIDIPQSRKRMLDFSHVRIIYESSLSTPHNQGLVNRALPVTAESKTSSPSPLCVTASPVANPVLGFQLPMMALMDTSLVGRPTPSPSLLSQLIKAPAPTQMPPP